MSACCRVDLFGGVTALPLKPNENRLQTVNRNNTQTTDSTELWCADVFRTGHSYMFTGIYINSYTFHNEMKNKTAACQ